jgi:CRISPR/Cas system CMR subunit Cmr4 (Cas7 group RAMP superfamily)
MKYRYVADIVIEAKTPLRLGSGKNDLFQDSPVQKDWNGLPMILGTSIAGIMREAYSGDKDDIFGYQKEKKDEGVGSRLIISNALLLDENNQVCEEYLDNGSEFIKLFQNLPIREHAAITDKGTTKKGGKFDEEIVFKGSRFKFRVELLASKANDDDKKTFESLLSLFTGEGIRIGAGSTKGFGRVAVADGFELKYFEGLMTGDTYQSLSSSLNTADDGMFTKIFNPQAKGSNKIHYTLQLKPDNFFMFGSGFGNEDNTADHTQVYEYVVDYNNGRLYTQKLLIPSTSLKGALSHRTAFYYNKKTNATIENGKGKVGEENDAVKKIFGYRKDDEDGQKGSVDFEDVFISTFSKKIFDHNKIDRFTGGTIDGALFAEETVSIEDDTINIKLEVKPEALEEDKIKESFENALKDICTGMLPLGGMTTKGHGVFCGKLLKDDNEVIIDMLTKGGSDDL